MNTTKNDCQVICFGEILWDVLPSGPVPGGAPMNVAYHLKKLGLNPILITRVGPDEEGKRLIELMEKQLISTDFFQMDFELPTGKVNATPGDNNEVVYDIIKPVAWDNIQWDPGFEKLVEDARYFIFGSLAARSESSRKTLYKLLEIARYKVLDINLRPPHFNRRIIEKLLNGVSLLKLNLSELEMITGWFAPYAKINDRIRVLQDKFKIPDIIVTRGGDGAFYNKDGVLYEQPGFKVEVVDTIGSGDASLAALVATLIRDDSPRDALEFSGALGALIASYRGPCPDYNIEEINSLIKQNHSFKN
jgi:fructokinase